MLSLMVVYHIYLNTQDIDKNKIKLDLCLGLALAADSIILDITLATSPEALTPGVTGDNMIEGSQHPQLIMNNEGFDLTLIFYYYADQLP